MVGLDMLKHARGISDDQVCAQWIENVWRIPPTAICCCARSNG
jgi:hypothetical protein